MTPQPTASVIAASVARHGKPIYTVEVTFHRFILAEMNTHRDFSRSYRSSRAVPVAQLLEEVRTNPWVPTKFGAAQKGMVSGPEVGQAAEAEQAWNRAAIDAVRHAQELQDLGVHKEQTNRLLEPFLPAVGVVTATEWGNFFRLRCAADAAPEMRAIAVAMRDAIQNAEPTQLGSGKWHLPYVAASDHYFADYDLEALRKISAARCARVSYGTQWSQKSIDEELAMANRLWHNGHLSPFEHQASPAWFRWSRSANFRGWKQSRHTRWWNDISLSEA